MRPYLILLILSITTVHLRAEACKIFKDCHKGNPLKHLENAVHDVGDNAANIVTLGAKKREEERKATAEAQKRAEIIRDNADRQKRDAISAERATIATEKLNIARNEKFIEALTLIEVNLESNLKSTQALIESAKDNKMRASMVLQIVRGQQMDLQKNLEVHSNGDARFQKLVEKVKTYNQQLQNFPAASATEEDLDNLGIDLAEQNFEVLAHLRNLKYTVSTTIKHSTNVLKAAEQRLSTLVADSK